MIISELDYLNTIVETPSVVGGYKLNISNGSNNLPEWFELGPEFQGVFQSAQLTDKKGDVVGEALTVIGQASGGIFSITTATIKL